VDIFDVSKVVPHGDYPLIEVGRLVLNKVRYGGVDAGAPRMRPAISCGRHLPLLPPSLDENRPRLVYSMY
jgi:hypothetical protein